MAIGRAAAILALLVLVGCSGAGGGMQLGGQELNPVSATEVGLDPLQGDTINTSQGSTIP